MPSPERCYIGLGANLGDPLASLRAAVGELRRLPSGTLLAVSSVYRSAPVDADGPDYYNAVAALDCALPAAQLLARLHAIEALHGRERSYVNAPRTLDLDLLLYGQLQVATARLTLPHPRLQQRAFVLLPLLEIAPALAAPGLGPLAGHLAGVAGQRIERLADCRLDT